MVKNILCPTPNTRNEKTQQKVKTMENNSKETVNDTINNSVLAAGWNPVWKSLPEVNTPVIILTDYGKCDVCRLKINEDLRTISWVNDMRPQHSNGNVVAWQYLPVLPDRS